MIAVDPTPTSTEAKHNNLLKLAKTKPAHATEIEAKLPPTLWKDYRISWTTSLADAKSNLVWIWSCTACKGHSETGKRNHWIDSQPRSVVDKVVQTFIDVDRTCREVRNTADVLNRLEAETSLLKEASFARRESIKLRNELYQGDVIEVLGEAVNGLTGGPCGVFYRMTTKLSVQSSSLPHDDQFAWARETKIIQQLARQFDRTAWPHTLLSTETAAGLGAKALATTYRKELAAYDIQIRPNNLRWILQNASLEGVRENAYQIHMPVVQEIGYKYSHAWLEHRRQVSATRAGSSVAMDLVKGTPFRTITDLVDTCDRLQSQSRPLLEEETAIIRKTLSHHTQKADLGEAALFEPWQYPYHSIQYEKVSKAKLSTESNINCFDRSRTLSTLRDLASGLLGVRLVLDPEFPGSQDGADSLEVWRVYGTATDAKTQNEIGRIFLDWSTKRKTASAKENPCRHMQVMLPAPLMSKPAPQVLWSLTFPSRSAYLPLNGVLNLAQELGEILDLIFRLAVDPYATLQPRYSSEAEKTDHAPLRITSRVLALLARQPRSLHKMLHPDAVQCDFVSRLIKTKHLTQIHQTRDQLARLHSWASLINAAADTPCGLSAEAFQKIHSETIDLWGTPVSYESRLPERLFHSGTRRYINIGIKTSETSPWLGPWIELRRGLKDTGTTLIAAQIVDRLVPCGIDQEETIFDQDIVKAYRAYLEDPIDHANPRKAFTKLFNSLGGKLDGTAFVRNLESDLAAFKQDDTEEDPRFAALRPLIVRIVKRRTANAKAKAASEGKDD